jgi:homoserine kinase
LALALGLYVEVEVREADVLTVTTEGEGADLPADASHMAARVASAVAGHDRLAIHVRSEIPVGRGLGSSAALAAAAAAAAGAPDPLAVAAEVDGHPENAAASVAGGLISATMVDGHAVVSPLALDDDLAFVVLIPDRRLATKEARGALPADVPHADAAFNLGRMGLLLSGLADAARLRPEATDDRLHQQQRAPLYPEAAGLMAGLVEAGALASCWSGAGPTLLGICRRASVADVRQRGDELLASHGVPGRSLVLDADRRGLTTTG